ncbi:MAG: histidine phosphatase family protein [Burkholderiaceae bacterium]|jgi:phosphohistidine phosphatase|nr:histidine phosphatase family protein [Burkholderiaceae bacterium]
MDLILWRHAEAENNAEKCDDMQRALTVRGHKQAVRMAAWLDQRLPENTRVLCSPALRCEQTALALGRKYKICQELVSDVPTADTLRAAHWPTGKHTMLLIGHQPALGQLIAQLIGLHQTPCSLQKGALWWLRAREREGQWQTLVVAAQSPETV